MSALMNPQPFPVPPSPAFSRCSPPRLAGRKRRADDDHDSRASSEETESMDHQMASASNFFSSRSHKKIRSNVQGRPLPLSRLLETVDHQTMKNILQTLCDRHPDLSKEVSELAPKPSVQSALQTLHQYERNYQSAFPYGGNRSGDYAYNRVRPALNELLEALSDYTPHFLPPNEAQPSVSLSFLDGATEIIHRLLIWENGVHNLSRQTAYEEMTKAWILVIQEAAKRGAGISLQYGGWESKLSKHNNQSEGKMQAAVSQMSEAIGWGGESPRTLRQTGGFGFGMHSGLGVSVRSQ